MFICTISIDCFVFDVQSYSEDLGELSRVMKERDELQVMLNKFERHMSEV